MAVQNNEICMYSYNTRGSNELKLKFIEDLINLSGNRITIVCIQEHFLLRNNLKKISNYFSNSSVISKPAFKTFEAQNRGRPKGGLSIILPKYLRKSVKIILCKSWRIQCIVIEVNGESTILINSYFPNDSGEVVDHARELDDCLAEIGSLLQTHMCNNYFLMGDLNADFLRNSSHVNCVKTFLSRHNMYSLWQDFPIDFSYSFEAANGNSYVKTLDHITTLERFRINVLDAGVIHRIENLSDHKPVYVIFRSTFKPVQENLNNISNQKISKPSWKMASDDQKLEYNDILFRKLLQAEVPESVSGCRNIKCRNPIHLAEIDSFMKTILDDITEAAEETIPKPNHKPRDKKQKGMAGWKDYVEPYQDRAKFWFSIWSSAGKPINTVLHNIMKKTRNQYQYQIRKCKRVEDFIKNKKLVENCLDGDNDLFEEIRKQRGKESRENVTIDGGRLPDKFAEVYQELYNRENDEDNLEELLNNISNDIGDEAHVDIEKIITYLLKKAL